MPRATSSVNVLNFVIDPNGIFSAGLFMALFWEGHVD